MLTQKVFKRLFFFWQESSDFEIEAPSGDLNESTKKKTWQKIGWTVSK